MVYIILTLSPLPGSYIANRAGQKLEQVHDKIVCCLSGTMADLQACAEIVRYYLDLHR